VDFTAVAEEGQRHGFEHRAFCSQGQFLTALGLDQLLAQRQESLPATAYAQELQAAKRLLLPNEMGERFKVLGLGKGLDSLPKGFQLGSLHL
jgi:SAM-dependent MidA family methyltransferase